jgi:hypothetical protein
VKESSDVEMVSTPTRLSPELSYTAPAMDQNELKTDPEDTTATSRTRNASRSFSNASDTETGINLPTLT